MKSFPLCAVLFFSVLGISPAAQPEIQWQQSYFSANWGNCPAHVCRANNGYTLAGISGNSITLVHVDATGQQRWHKEYTTYDSTIYALATHEVYSLQSLNDNGCILSGMRSTSLQTPDKDAWVLRVDSSGSVIWKRAFGVPGYQSDTPSVAYCVRQARNGDFLIAGSFRSAAWVCRIDSLGRTVWANGYDGTAARSLVELDDGGIVAVGDGLLKISNNGALLWRKNYNPGTNALAKAVRRSIDGTIVVLGEADGKFSLALGRFVAKSVFTCIDTGGNKLWEKTYGNAENGYDVLNSMSPVSNAGYVLAGGQSSGTPDGRNRLWMVRTNSVGDTIWTYTCPELSFAHSIDITPDSGYIVAAEQCNLSVRNRTDLLTISNRNAAAVRWHVDPGKTGWKNMTLADLSTMKLKIFDMQGRLIADCTGKLQRMKPGENTMKGLITNLPIGIYAVRLFNGTKTVSEKLAISGQYGK